MFSKTRLAEVRHSLAFRLTLWYAGIFILSASAAFFFFYLLITSVLRQQTDQDLLSEARAFSSILSSRGAEALKQQALLQAQAAGEKKIFFRLLYIDGRVFSSSNMSYWRDISISRDAVRRLLDGGASVFDTIHIPNRRYKVRVLYAIIGPGMILQLGQSLENHTRIIEVFRRVFIATMAVLFVMAAVVGWFMARRALAGVERVTRTARRISGGSLEERVPVNRRVDEIDQLAITFNRMLDRIQKLVTEIREMSDNIAHDLKGPVTRLRGIAEVSLTSGSSLAEYENMAAGTIEECDRLMNMIDTMLIISRTEAGVDPLASEEIDISRLTRDACELFHPMAEEKGVKLACEAEGLLAIRGDTRMIQRMVANLLDNAIKYTPTHGTVAVTTRPAGDGLVQISVKDTGIGIAREDLPHIFERFYRCDPSRSQSGTGLGLSFARAVARAHGGDISVTSNPANGSIFSVTLPRADSASRQVSP